jgi:hypothetical protein
VNKVSKAALLALAIFCTACELREITLAMPSDVLVAEIILREGSAIQTAYLHRTRTPESASRVLDADIAVTDVATGAEIRFEAGPDSLCVELSGGVPGPGIGTCYIARGTRTMVRGGARYLLEIRLGDGRRLTGATTVPHEFEITQPAAPCRLAPQESLQLVWTQSAGAWVYIVETRMDRLIEALKATGVDVPRQGSFDLLGLSIGAADTTMTFPGQVGLFSRVDESLHPILVAIRDGLPPGVTAEIAIAAADRNYVNWVRGGSFNPSGSVRVPSLSGSGTGVFGSLVIRRTTLHTDQVQAPPCR